MPTVMRQENHYILLSNQKKCKEILIKGERTREDKIDFLISLHLVLENGLNAFYRHVILDQLQKGIEQTEIASNLDRIDFITKTTLFLYLPSYDFLNEIDKANDYHKVIGKLINFSEIRNKLLHGHMDGQVTYYGSSETVVNSRTFDLISDDSINLQISNFKFIVDAIKFYFDHLKSSFTTSGKDGIKDSYLDSSFLVVDNSVNSGNNPLV